MQATVCEYNKLKQETESLKAVCDLRGEDIRNLRSEIAKVNQIWLSDKNTIVIVCGVDNNRRQRGALSSRTCYHTWQHGWRSTSATRTKKPRRKVNKIIIPVIEIDWQWIIWKIGQKYRRLQSEVQRLESNYRDETMMVQRLSMQNEQLFYKLQSLPRRPSPTHSQNGTWTKTTTQPKKNNLIKWEKQVSV